MLFNLEKCIKNLANVYDKVKQRKNRKIKKESLVF